MKKSIYLSIYLAIFLSVSLNAQVNNSKDVEKNEGIKRNAMYNLEEIKVRWKKAALENCPGVPCPPPPPSFTCGTSAITDVDGNTYNTVSIGTQCWSKENLKVTKYNDGTSIPLDASGGSGGNGGVVTWSGLATGAYTIYGNESSTGPNATNYGFLYNWYAAAGIITTGGSPTKNICPSGWHVPTDAEWTILIQTLDPDQLVNSGNVLTFTGFQSPIAGDQMKSTDTQPTPGGWNSPNTGATNSSSFSAIPGGSRDVDGSFTTIRNNAFFWSATEYDFVNAWYRILNYLNGIVFRNNYTKRVGFSVRCLRD
jgi:uncharacterized protein (TIGR02145 family)